MIKNVFRILSVFLLAALIVPTAQAQEALTETFTTPDGSVSIMYPASWTASQDSGSIELLSDLRLGYELPSVSGDMTVIVFANETLSSEVRDAANIHDAIARPGLEVVDFTVGDHPAARVSFEISGGDGEYDAEEIGVDYGNGQRILVLGATFSGERDLLHQMMVAMLESLQLEGGASSVVASVVASVGDTPTFTASDGSYSIMYPAGWSVSEESDGSVLFVSREGMNLHSRYDLIMQSAALFESGDAAVIFVPISDSELPDNINDNAVFLASYYSFVLNASGVPTDELTIGSYPAVRAVVSIPDDPHYDVEAIALDIGNDQIAYMVGNAAPGELAALDPIMLAMIESLQFGGEASTASVASTPSVAFTGEMQTYTAPDGSLSIMYPVGWTANEGPISINFVSDPRLQSEFALVSGDMMVSVLLNESLTSEVTDSDNIHDAIASVAEGFNIPLLEVVDFKVGDHPAARGPFDSPTLVDPFIGEFIGVDYGNGQRVLAQGVTFTGERAALEPIMLAMIESLQFGEGAAATETPAETTAPAVASTEAGPDATATEAATTSAATCTVTAPGNANLRSGPGTSFNVAASLAAGQTAEADGQTTGADGATWYRLTTDSWVRSDIINAAAECSSVPTVTG